MVDDTTPEDAEDSSLEEDEGETLDAGAALAQAANVLVTAADKAEIMNDVQALMKIAGGWMEIHEYLTGGSHEFTTKTPLGFANAKPQTQTREEEELDDAVAAEGYSKRRIHSQHGELRKFKGRYFR